MVSSWAPHHPALEICRFAPGPGKAPNKISGRDLLHRARLLRWWALRAASPFFAITVATAVGYRSDVSANAFGSSVGGGKHFDHELRRAFEVSSAWNPQRPMAAPSPINAANRFRSSSPPKRAGCRLDRRRTFAENYQPAAGVLAGCEKISDLGFASASSTRVLKSSRSLCSNPL